MKPSIERLLCRARKEARKAQEALRRRRSIAAVYAHRERAVAYHAKALLLSKAEV